MEKYYEPKILTTSALQGVRFELNFNNITQSESGYMCRSESEMGKPALRRGV